jgi:hypothetical protein
MQMSIGQFVELSKSVVSGQLSVVSCQWSVVSGQLSVANFVRPAVEAAEEALDTRSF